LICRRWIYWPVLRLIRRVSNVRPWRGTQPVQRCLRVAQALQPKP